ncbi:MAG: patatin family protein [Corynebacterium sp.]|uniref:patatin-like phospholipase family protein n=1 Tax=Corynebacterium sp. TaxID=1720 RepID=UPI0026DB9574|nr:patatin family protein [Corynebacterium sp.]MDO5029800.1 patatin family protein [Corynebacterium sp.]
MQVSDVALIFEGGGTRNSYTAPFVERLLREKIDVGWVGGISAGATHVVNYLSRDIHRSEECFVDFIASPGAGGWGPMLRGRGYFDAEYIYEAAGLPDGAMPLDYKTFKENPIPYRIPAVRADTGETVNWGPDDIPDLDTLMKYTRASSTIPGAMRIPIIDGIPYVDGALGTSGGIALDAAEADGFEKFIIVLTRPKGFRRVPPSRPHVIRRILRKYPAVAEAIITRHERYNATLDHAIELERQGKAYIFYANNMSISKAERKLPKLKHNYDLGLAQTNSEWSAIREFMGI